MLICDRDGCAMPVQAFGQSRVIDGFYYHFCCSACLSVFYRQKEYEKRQQSFQGGVA